jgi:ABC-2 type transport system permease protein
VTDPAISRTLNLPRPTRSAGALTTALGVARRTVRRNVRNPQVFVLGMVQGAMFLLIFRYVFGGAISTQGVRYVDFLVPGYVGTGVLFSGMMASIVAGRVVADTALAAIGLTVTTVVGFAMGFRTTAPVGNLLLAVALCLFATFAFTWMFVLLGIIAGNPQAAQGLGLIVFPFTFVSSAFVPVESMPGWMQAFARNQPLTEIVNATRAFTLGDDAQRVLGHSAGYFATRSLFWCAAFIAVFAPLAARRYRHG